MPQERLSGQCNGCALTVANTSQLTLSNSLGRGWWLLSNLRSVAVTDVITTKGIEREFPVYEYKVCVLLLLEIIKFYLIAHVVVSAVTTDNSFAQAG